MSAAPLEAEALAAASARLGGARPRTSPALVLAARALARRAADGDPDPLARAKVRAALAGALAFDAAPVAHLAEGEPGRVAEALASHVGGSRPSPTHAGAGAVVRDGRAYLVLLLSQRPVSLRPFPREVAPGTTATLSGDLVGLERPSVHVTAPGGESREVGAAGTGVAFRAPIRFDAPGRWTVEVVGAGSGGPQVAAILTVACGGAGLEDTAAGGDEADPADPAAAEARVVAALQATRARHGLPPLTPWPALSEAARHHSEAMLAAGLLAHVLPGGGGPGERLKQAHLPYALVLENVAMGGTALAAHRTAEESPAHRQNILTREATRLGCGIARGRLAGGEPVVYLTELFVQPVEDGADDRMTPEGRVREALWRERARLGAPPLLSDPVLDGLAREAARRMARAGEPSDAGLGQRALGLGRKEAAVDAFVASRAADATRSHNLADRRLRRVGVGVTVADSPRYGAGLLWIAVVYTD